MQQPTMDQPAKGVREFGSPTAFLLKTYEIVDDPNSNSIISWSRSGTSFIVWDHIKMAAELLPRLFKHSNFSSFVYQLNNYGFRKIGLEQREYENEWFQAGKKHLLGNIKRRNQISRAIAPRGRRKRSNIDPTTSSEMEAEELENESTVLKSSKVEIQKLKQQLEDIEFRIAFSKEQMKNMESKSRRVVMFFARALGQTFVQDVIQHIGMEKESENSETVKKRKLLPPPESTENAAKISEMPTLVSADDSESDIPTTAENASKICLHSFWTKLMEDDPCENEDEREQARQQSMIDMELDEMIASKIEAQVSAKPTHSDAEEEIALQLWA